MTDLLPGKYRVEFQAGCGKSGVKTQWWRRRRGQRDREGHHRRARLPTVSGIDAAMTGG